MPTITGTENGEVLHRPVAERLVGFAAPADNPKNVFARVTFLKNGRAFPIGLNAGMIEQVVKDVLGQKGEEREIL